MFCVKCGTEFDGKFCPNCGEPAPEKRFCPHCGKAIEDPTITVCPECGANVPVLEKQPPKITVSESQPSAPSQPTIVINNTNTNENTNVAAAVAVTPDMFKKPKNKWVAFLLCLFLGVVGAHKFYEGKTGMGILYLCTLGICFVGVVIDLIAILMKPNPYYV